MTSSKKKKTIGIAGVPPWDAMMEYIRDGAEIIDLDEPLDEFPVRESDLPGVYCSILRRVASNARSLREAGRLDLLLAAVGEDKCDGMRYIAEWISRTTDIPVRRVKNENLQGAGHPISTSGLPLLMKMELIVNSVFRPVPEGTALERCEPGFGFWGVPPSDFSPLALFPDDTHIYGWTRCMENKTPADLELEMFVDPGVPTIFFAQSFCQKSFLAHSLAKKTGGLCLELDRTVSRSARAKIEAFVKFNYSPSR